MSRREVSAKGLVSAPAPEGVLALTQPDKVQQRAIWRVLFSANHKDIGTLYSLLAFIGGSVGGVLSLLVGQQLLGAAHGFVSNGNVWNEVITSHGLAMIFWFVVPALIGGMGNWLVPLMIGAADTAFPRLNLLSFWGLALGFVALLCGLLLHSAYAPVFSFSAFVLAGISVVLGAINFIVTILNMRAAGLGLHKMPLFCWSLLVTAFLVLLVVPVLGAMVTLLVVKSGVGLAAIQTDPALFSYLFWFVGHPAGYIIILPALGVVSQIIETFARRPIQAYFAVVYAMVAIGFVGFVVWAHRLFFPASMDHYINASALILAIPAAIIFVAWGITLCRGSLSFKTPLLWALGFMALFAVGGLMGMVIALSSTQTVYSVVAHFHYVLAMGAVFAVFGGFYYWVGKVSGRAYPEVWGKVHFWTFFAGVNLTFFPMEFSVYQDWSVISTCGALLSGISVLVFFYVVFRVLFSTQTLPGNYWGEGATTLEWTLPSPVPLHTFMDLPSIR